MTLGKTPGAHGASRPHSIFAALARRELDWPMARPASGPDLPVGATDGSATDPPPSLALPPFAIARGPPLTPPFSTHLLRLLTDPARRSSD